MTKKEAYHALVHHQAWRKGEDCPMLDTKEITKAIDKAIEVLKP